MTGEIIFRISRGPMNLGASFALKPWLFVERGRSLFQTMSPKQGRQSRLRRLYARSCFWNARASWIRTSSKVSSSLRRVASGTAVAGPVFGRSAS